MIDDTNWDVVFQAVVRQHQHPEENGGGMIGKAAAVLKALHLDPDAPFTKSSDAGPKTVSDAAGDGRRPSPAATTPAAQPESEK